MNQFSKFAVRIAASSIGAGVDLVVSTPIPMTDFLCSSAEAEPYFFGHYCVPSVQKTQFTVCTERYGFYAWKR